MLLASHTTVMLASPTLAGGTKTSVPDNRASRIFCQALLVRYRKKPSSTVWISFVSCSGMKARKAPVFRDPSLAAGVAQRMGDPQEGG
jgi:hypothetical protein